MKSPPEVCLVRALASLQDTPLISRLPPGKEVDASLQVKAKVNEDPFRALPLGLLLQHEHAVVEELLQLLVGDVDAQLFKAVELCWEGRGGNEARHSHSPSQDQGMSHKHN